MTTQQRTSKGSQPHLRPNSFLTRLAYIAGLSVMLVLWSSGMTLAKDFNTPKTSNNIPNFEGEWEDCFKADWNGAPKNGSEICGGYYLFQKGKKICGEWTGFATVETSGYLQAIVTDKNTAEITKVCGSGGLGHNPCPIDVKKEAIVWAKPEPAALVMCRGKLLLSGTCSKKSKFYKLKSKVNSEKDALNVPWIQSCLNSD